MMSSSSTLNFEDVSPSRLPADRSRLSEDYLLDEATSGNEYAFVELFEQYRSQLELSVLRIVRNRHDAEDIVQDTMLSALRHLHSFRRDCKFSTWITRIGINKSLMLIRKRAVRSEASVSQCDSELNPFGKSEFPDCAPNPEQVCGKRMINDAVLTAVGRLPISLRGIFEHYYREECSLEESAVAFGLTTAAAKSRIMRARLALRSSLKKRRISMADVLF